MKHSGHFKPAGDVLGNGVAVGRRRDTDHTICRPEHGVNCWAFHTPAIWFAIDFAPAFEKRPEGQVTAQVEIDIPSYVQDNYSAGSCNS